VEEMELLLKKLFATFPKTPVQPETVAVYLEFLAGYEPDVLKWAIEQACVKCATLPSVAEIRSLADERKAANKAWAVTMPDDAHLLEDSQGGVRYTKIYKTTREEERAQLRRWNAVNQRNKQERIL